MKQTHAVRGGEDDYGKHFKGGEFCRFYVPRDLMPQVAQTKLPEVIYTAYDELVEVDFEVVDPQLLTPHQRVNHEMAKDMPSWVKRLPILVSSDSYVLDGNHRWWAHYHAGDNEILVLRIGLEFNKGIDWLLELLNQEAS